MHKKDSLAAPPGEAVAEMLRRRHGDGIGTTAPLPLAAWPWRRPPGFRFRAPLRPSAAPETEQQEQREGLSPAVSQQWLRRAGEILGPLRFEVDRFRPLSMEGGRLRAAELSALPSAANWRDVFVDVEHVQTASPEVCAALASTVRSFVVRTAACAELLRAVRPEIDVAIADAPSPPSCWLPAPRLDGYLLLFRLAEHVWAAWDVDEDRPAVVDIDGYPGGPSYDPGNYAWWRHSLVEELPLGTGPAGPLPYAPTATPPPAALAAHLACAGSGWAAAVSDRDKGPAILSHPSGRTWSLLHIGTGRGGQHGLSRGLTDDYAWLCVHAAEQGPDAALKQTSWSGSLAQISLEEQRVRFRRSGLWQLLRLRAGQLEVLVEPQRLSEVPGWSEGMPDPVMVGLELRDFGFPLMPDDTFLVCTCDFLNHFPLTTLPPLLVGELRAVAAALQAELHTCGIEENVLLLGAQAQSACNLAWLPALSIELGPAALFALPAWAEKDADPQEQEGLWTLHRFVARPYALALHNYNVPSPPWTMALQKALEHAQKSAAIAARELDVFRTWLNRKTPIQLQLQDGHWRVVRTNTQPKARAGEVATIAKGRVIYPDEQARGPWATFFQDLERRPQIAEAIAAAEADGLPTLALYLRLRQEFIAGRPAPGLEHLERWISPRTRAACARFLTSPESRLPRRVLAASLALDPQRFHGCAVRSFVLASAGRERLVVAGAWWHPSAEHPPQAQQFLGELKADWLSDGRCGYGPLQKWPALAVGEVLEMKNPATRPGSGLIRTVTEEDLRMGRVRAGVLVRCTLELTADERAWWWSRTELICPSALVPERRKVTAGRLLARLVLCFVQEWTICAIEETRTAAAGTKI